MNKERTPLFYKIKDYKPLKNTSGSIRDEKDVRSLAFDISKEVESLRNSSLVTRARVSASHSPRRLTEWKADKVTGARKMQGMTEQFDKLDMSAMLKLELAQDRERISQQALPEVSLVSSGLDRKMKAKEKHPSKLWLEIEHLNKGIMQREPSSSALALSGKTTNAVAQCETDPVKINFYISSRSTSPSSHSGDEADSVKIIDSAHLPVHTPTIKRKEYHSRVLFPSKNNTHRFFLTSFTAPTKCHQCTSLMVGLIRQGCACDACGFLCHTTCVEKAPKACPVSSQQKKHMLHLDPPESMGTVYEGYIWIPRKAGVKKGWQRALAVVCDFKLFLYCMDEENDSKPNVVVSQVIDMRDGAFSVSSVWPSDFIPVRRKEMSRIFQVTASQLSAPSNKYAILILADSENEKNEWVGVLSELHKILRKSHSRDRTVYILKEAYDCNLPLIKTTQTAAIIDRKRIVLGNEEGLFVVHITIDEILQVGNMKKIHQVELIPHGQMVAVISGRSHRVQLFPMSVLDGRKANGHKLSETKGCQTMTSGMVCHGTHTCLCVARKNQIFCYELFQSKEIFHRKFKEIQIPTNVQWMAILSEQLCVGFQSGFLRYPLKREGIPYSMLHLQDPTLSFIVHQPVDALCAIEISSIEYLLCFKSIGIYTDSRGLRSRPVELMWPATPTYCCYNAPYLSMYSENAVDIFDVNSMEWIQTIPLKKVRPLNSEGSLNILLLETIRLIYFKNKMKNGDELLFPESSANHQKQMVRHVNNKWRYSFRAVKGKGTFP
ncbi:serine/threonine-protein kinase MRCK alpha-like [Erinaceus europaeus]|uniref:Serine/threonine-protein kinase MRCK alpha-like n=1 Tax=Erinaceus europaeus TaxID=9365 RepID=A0ABM3Y5Z8_ERIEU|nr:serine/threonine-protein kinase MRCK alpha-like [Erinaceus europaeus]